MDSMYSLLCFKPPIQSEEFYNSWTNDLEKYVDQSNVFLDFMLKNSNSKSTRWKRAHKASLRLHLTGMVKRLQSMPRTPKGEELIRKLGVTIAK